MFAHRRPPSSAYARLRLCIQSFIMMEKQYATPQPCIRGTRWPSNLPHFPPGSARASAGGGGPLPSRRSRENLSRRLKSRPNSAYREARRPWRTTQRGKGEVQFTIFPFLVMYVSFYGDHPLFTCIFTFLMSSPKQKSQLSIPAAGQKCLHRPSKIKVFDRK